MTLLRLEGGILEKATSHHVVELALKRIEAADNSIDFVVEMILVPSGEIKRRTKHGC